MDRADWHQLAEERLLDAQALLAAGRWSGAYYLAGYAVECALKSCVLAHLASDLGVIFRDKRFSEKSWSHNFDELVRLADLTSIRDSNFKANPALRVNWETVGVWTETSRYQLIAEPRAIEILQAIDHPTDGVLPWLRRFW